MSLPGNEIPAVALVQQMKDSLAAHITNYFNAKKALEEAEKKIHQITGWLEGLEHGRKVEQQSKPTSAE